MLDIPGRGGTPGTGLIRGIPVDFLTQFSHTGTVNVSGKIPTISGRFWSILAAGYGHGISAANSCHFPSGSGRKLGVSGEFPGGILRQESSSWVLKQYLQNQIISYSECILYLLCCCNNYMVEYTFM